jgi:hypothetical protein
LVHRQTASVLAFFSPKYDCGLGLAQHSALLVSGLLHPSLRCCDGSNVEFPVIENACFGDLQIARFNVCIFPDRNLRDLTVARHPEHVSGEVSTRACAHLNRRRLKRVKKREPKRPPTRLAAALAYSLRHPPQSSPHRTHDKPRCQSDLAALPYGRNGMASMRQPRKEIET